MNYVLSPNAILRFVINDTPMAQEYCVRNCQHVALREIMGDISVLMRCFTSSFCTINKIIRCPGYLVLYATTTNDAVQPDSQLSCCSLVRSVDPSLLVKTMGQNDLVEISEDHATLCSVLETLTRIPRTNYADAIENIFLLTYHLVIKAHRPSNCCECKDLCVCLQKAASPAYTLINAITELITLHASSDVDKIKVREWRESAFKLLRRWLVVRYPEDIDDDIIELVEKLHEYVKQEGDIHADKAAEDLLLGLQNRITSISSPASLLYYLLPKFDDTLNFDLVHMKEIADNDMWPEFRSRIVSTSDLRPIVNSDVNAHDRLQDIFRRSLIQETPRLALELTQYFASSYLTVTPRDASALSSGTTTENIRRLIEKHNALARLVQLAIFGISVTVAETVLKEREQIPESSNDESVRSETVVYLTYLTELLFELGCIEGVFCIVSAVETQVCYRVLNLEQREKADAGFSGDGEDLDKFGRLHLEAGVRQGSKIAESFYNGEKLIYNKYIPYYERGKRLFEEHRRIKEGQMYSLEELEIMVKENFEEGEEIKYYENVQAFAWKLGKPVNASQLVSMEGNYKRYREFMAAAIRNKQPIIPYLGILSRDLIFTCDGNPSHCDEKTKQIINFRRLEIVYDYIMNYLAPQVNLLGYCVFDDEMYFSSNIIADNMHKGKEIDLLLYLDSFAESIDSLISEDEMWDLSSLVRKKATE